jgi:AraC-like DNA-binding protein
MPCFGQETRAFSDKNSGRQQRNRSVLWNPGGVLVTADPLFEKVLLELGAERPARGFFYATAQKAPPMGGEPTLDSRRHVSDGHEFTFAMQGRIRVATAVGITKLCPGQLFLIGRDVTKEESPWGERQSSAMGWCYTRHSFALVGQTTYVPGATWKVGPTINLLGRTDVESIAAAALAELSQKHWGWQPSACGLLKYLSSILIRRLRRGSVVRLRPAESPTVSPDQRTWRLIRSALDCRDENFRRSPRLADIAAAVGYSPSHLSRLISTHLGHSLSDHIRNLRMQAGTYLMESSEMSIGEIACSLGYTDPSHFSRAFARATGVSPKAYRNRLRGM